MKKIIPLYRYILVFFLILVMPAGIVFAGSGKSASLQVGSPTPTVSPTVTPENFEVSPVLSLFQIPGLQQTNIKPQIPDTMELFTFEQFGLSEGNLSGPFATKGYYFDLPLTWKMKQGAVLHLVLDTYYTSPDSGVSLTPNSASNYIGSLEIQYNYTTIGRVDLIKSGRMQVDVPIPLDVIDLAGSNQGHSLLLILDSGINCNFNSNTTVTVRSISQLYMPHDLVEPPSDLRKLPSPFYLDSFNQDTAIIVVPNQPTAAELQAALSISAGFGSMTFDNLLIGLLPVNQVSEELLASTNLIFVGNAKDIPLLNKVKLPATISSDGSFVASGSSPTDGFIQLAVSPWNKTKVALVVSGNDDNGVIKAARAVSTGKIQVGSNPSLSLVSDVQLTTPAFNPADTNQTFADLGYDSNVVNQVGLNVVNYSFYIPQNYTIGPDAYLDLNFSHTALLEYQRSTVVINLNDQPIGSVRLSDETVGQGNAKIYLPASAARPGENKLSLEIDLEPRNVCVNPTLNGLWMRIDSSSTLHLPYIPVTVNPSTIIDLGKYPFPFVFDPIMKDLAFVLSDSDPIAWNVAAQLASQLGNTNRTQLAGIEVFYSDSISDTARKERNLIVIGRPSKLEILSELKDFMPLPFQIGSDIADQKNIQVSYHLSEGVDVGYLEIFTAPWSSDRTILYIGGSSDLGVRWAGAALQSGRLRSQLNGNLAFISGEQVVATETRSIQGNQDVSIPVDVSSTTDLQPQVIPERPAWILPTIVSTIVLIVIVLIVIGAQTFMQKRSDKQE